MVSGQTDGVSLKRLLFVSVVVTMAGCASISELSLKPGEIQSYCEKVGWRNEAINAGIMYIQPESVESRTTRCIARLRKALGATEN